MTFFDAYMTAMRAALLPGEVLRAGVEEQHGGAVGSDGLKLAGPSSMEIVNIFPAETRVIAKRYLTGEPISQDEYVAAVCSVSPLVWSEFELARVRWPS